MKNKKSDKNKNKKFSLNIIATYLLIISFLFAGVTYSKYMSADKGSDMARTATFGNLHMYEVNKEGLEVTEPLVTSVVPGVDIFKNFRVDFASEKDSEMSSYVFVEVKTKGWIPAGDYRYVITRDTVATKGLLSWMVDNTKWTYLSTSKTGDEMTRVYYKKVNALEKLNKVPVMKVDKNGNTIEVSEDITMDEIENISALAGNMEFTSYAVQAAGFDTPMDAWNAVSGGQGK